MNSTITLSNVSFRVVGTFMRINQPFTAVPAPSGVPFTVDLPQITVGQPPTVGALMAELASVLPTMGLTFEYGDLPPPTRPNTLDFIKYGPKGKEYVISAQKISQLFEKAGFAGPNGESLGLAWQYYVFYKEANRNDDTRVEVSGRARYTESVMLQDNCRVIWRPIVTFLNPKTAGGKTDVKDNGVDV